MTTYTSVPTSVRSENLDACGTNHHTHANIIIGSDGTRTHRDHLRPTHMERLVVLSARRFDLNVVPRPAALPQRGLLRTIPLARELSARVVVRKVCVGSSAERRKAVDKMPQFARPIVRPKVVQLPAEHFVNLSLF